MNTKKTKIGILGMGAIGTVISYELHKNKLNELFYFSRSPKNELKLISKGTKIEIPVNIQTSIEDVPPLDWLIICLKAYHYPEARHWFFKLITPNTQIAVIRNGIKLKAPLLDYTTEERIVECMIDCPTQLKMDGFYEQISKPIITIAQNNLSLEFDFLFKNSSVLINQIKDFKTANWKKICESSALGAILCLSGETCWVFQDEKMKTLFINILEEGLLVAQADGAKIKSSFIHEMTTKLMAYPDTKGSSMLTDRLNGKRIELGAKNGIISTLGKTHNINTPINDLIVLLLSKTNRNLL